MDKPMNEWTLEEYKVEYGRLCQSLADMQDNQSELMDLVDKQTSEE